jgi:hypothetical protein
MSSGVAGARNKRTSGGKKPGGGASILKMVKQNQERADLIGHKLDQEKVEACASWHIKSEQNHSADNKRKADTHKEEISMANCECRARRRRCRCAYGGGGCDGES